MEIVRPDQLTFDVDMNSLRGDQVGTLLTLASDPLIALMFPPQPGDIVKVKDEDGGVYDAHVDAVDDIWLGVTINWESRVVVTVSNYRGAVFGVKEVEVAESKTEAPLAPVAA